MTTRILHLIDSSTSSDAMEMLALLLSRTSDSLTQKILSLGHRSSELVAEMAGIPKNTLKFLPSAGWADPSGWRSVRREIANFQPTHIQAWGISAIVAAEVANFNGSKSAVIADLPPSSHLRLLRVIDTGRFSRKSNPPWKFIASSSSILRSLLAKGLNPNHLQRIRPGIPAAKPPADGPLALRSRLGITPTDGPIFLLGGEGRNARHDFGLWSAAILQQFFPHLKVIIRLDPRNRPNIGLERLLGTLPDEEMLILAPPNLPWRELVHAADLLLITADSPTPLGSILHAMAASIPVIATPIEPVSELVEHNHNGLLAKAVKPRAIAARIEEFMADSTLKWPLTDHARADIYAHFSISAMIEGMMRVWSGEEITVATRT